ncbi:MAG TPA: ABC transporter permease subunit, partial [Clostridia bacterium]|nr:ABC transporter permease subunit [Clostridia bacterium]
NLILARTFMQSSIPDALDEAALIDGCTPIRFYLTVVLPLSLPIIGVLCLYSVVGHWNAYYSALIYLTERKRYPLQLVLREILVQSKINAENLGTSAEEMEDAFEYLNLSETLKYGLVIISSVPMLVLYPFLQKFFVKGIMIGSVKG